jgi:SRSO17 transposase
MGTAADWGAELERWMAPFLEVLGHKNRRRWAPLYVQGLLGPGDRKSIQPMAGRILGSDRGQLHHFVAASSWETAPLEQVLAEQAQRLVGGPEAVLIVDDTTLLKQGKHSPGVARQYSGAAGKRANCQALVSLTLARGEVPLPVALRLFLPEEWTKDPERCRRAGIPEDRLAPRSKMQIALEELDRVRAAGVQFGCVVADAGYGMSADFRRALTARDLLWAVGIPRIQKVYPAEVTLLPAPAARPRGRPRKYPVPSAERQTAEDVLAALPWRRVTWRRGTRGPLWARFAAVRIRVADGVEAGQGQHLPGAEAWLVGEERSSGERKYYLTNHPPRTPLRQIAGAIKARWACEQAHQQMKEELGLDHFEGRTWGGLHHHALLVMIAYAFLQHLRLKEASDSAGEGSAERGKNAAEETGSEAAPGTTTAADATGDPTASAGDPADAAHPMLPPMRLLLPG